MKTPQSPGWFPKNLLNWIGLVIALLVVLIIVINIWQYSSMSIISQIRQDSNLLCDENVPIKAVNKYTGEVKEFSNSCQFPRGWTKTAANHGSATNSGTYRNYDYGFSLKVTPDFKTINYSYNGKVDYVGVYLSSDTNDGIFINPKGGQDLLIPDSAPTEQSFATIDGKNVRVRKWDLASGRSLIRYVFKDSLSNWNACPDVDKPTINCNRIDVYASNVGTLNKLIPVIGNISFFAPTSATTTTSVYYYAGNKLHIYNPSTSSEVTKNLTGLTNYAVIKKISNNQVVYLNNDEVSTYDLGSGEINTLFSKNTENGITYVPDSFAVSADNSKIAIGYRHGSSADVLNCSTKCKNAKVGILVVDLNSGLTKGSFDIDTLASPIVWVGQDIVLRRWDSSGYSSVSQSGTLTPSYQLSADLVPVSSTNADTQLIRDDKTAAVAIRNQQDRFGTASYLFVNGKVIYKGGLASINLVGN